MTATSLAEDEGRRDPQARKAQNAAAFRRQERNERAVLSALAVPGFLLIGVIALAPIAWLFWLSFRDKSGFTLEHYERLLHPTYTLTLETTFQISLLVTVICIALGYPLAYLISQASNRLAAFLMLLVLFPILDLAAGALLCLARAPAAARDGQQLAAGHGSDRYAAQADAQLHRHH